MLVAALGGGERRLAETSARWARLAWSGEANWSSSAWSPDGKTIAILDSASVSEPRGVFLISVETGEKRRLTRPPDGTTGDSYPTFSPDGRALAFVRFRGFGSSDIFLLPVETGGEPRRLTSEQRDIRGLDWTADGGSLVFSSNRAGGQTLWKVPLSGGSIEPVAFGGQDVYSFSIARRGERLVFEHYLADTNLWRSPGPGLAGGRPAARTVSFQQAAPLKAISSTKEDEAPQFSPDGARIAFSTNRSGYPEIWVSHSDGSGAVQVTSFRGSLSGSPRWSPDGRWLALDSRKEGNADIYVVASDGGPVRRLTTDPSDEVRPSWSRDGRWIYFGSNRTGAWQVWKTPPEPAAGSQPALQVTRNGGREAFESIDGQWVYFAKQQGVFGLWRLPVQGGEETQLLDEGHQSLWGILGEGICLFRSSPQGSTLDFFHPASRQRVRLAQLPSDWRIHTGSTPAFSIAPDGRSILWTRIDHIGSDLVLVEPFR